MYSHRIVLFIIILVCHFNCPAFANNSSENLNPAEKYVIEQVEKGKGANFREVPVENRILSADFLKELLTGSLQGLKITMKGIRIYHARINEKLDISNEKIPFPVYLRFCIFDKDVVFSDTTFSEKADFFGTKFSGEAGFLMTKFSEKADFNSAKFSEKANFTFAKFYGETDFNGAKFSEWVSFHKTKFFGKAGFFMTQFPGEVFFTRAEFSGEADFNGAKFSGEADFEYAKFSGEADFYTAEFSEKADFYKTKFSGRANFAFAKFSGEAGFEAADLYKAIFGNADLSGANLSEADLREADLSETNLKDCLLWNVRGFPLNYEPKAGSPPYIPSIATLYNLSKLTFKKSPHGLVDLREGFKKLGYREQERKITYAIKHTQRRKLWNYSKEGIKGTEGTESEKDSKKSIRIWDKFEGLFYLLFFELTCQYGMKPGRPLIILMCLIPSFSFFYIFALKTKRKKTGLWLIFLKDSVLKPTKEERPFKLTAKFPPRVTPTGKLNKIKLRVLRSYRTIRIALYFSLLSATTIGWREFNVGNWISRLQRREYTLRATGWVRTVSGLQSLISVYLLALWVLTYFGRPFEAV